MEVPDAYPQPIGDRDMRVINEDAVTDLAGPAPGVVHVEYKMRNLLPRVSTPHTDTVRLFIRLARRRQ
ncbi:MAG TPA: hypothetical protein DGT21_09835 [Armatimonadetes bacterium]|nr:hypothetical protein [Armatimonadota bacterium]